MPLLKEEQIDEYTKILIWHITEPNAFFEKKLSGYFDSPYPWDEMIPKREREYLASRYILQKALPRGFSVAEYSKDKNGTPGITESEICIGISHSHDLTACIVSNRRVGCDIEIYQDRILNLSDRFMTPENQKWAEDQNRLKKTHLIWGIKESAYKTWGRRKIDWKEDIDIAPFDWDEIAGEFQGQIGKNNRKIPFFGNYQYFDNFLFVWTIEG